MTAFRATVAFVLGPDLGEGLVWNALTMMPTLASDEPVRQLVDRTLFRHSTTRAARCLSRCVRAVGSRRYGPWRPDRATRRPSPSQSLLLTRHTADGVAGTHAWEVQDPQASHSRMEGYPATVDTHICRPVVGLRV